MNSTWRGCACLVFLLAFLSTNGQQVTFNHLTVENGLSHNSVLAIAQDARGFMWYGTRYGLNRYDGQRFRIYQSRQGDTTGLSENLILSLFADSKKTLWVGTAVGLCRYDPEKDAFQRVALTPGQPENVNAIFEDRKGRLWIAAGSGLYLQTDSLHHFRKFTQGPAHLAGSNVRSICQDLRGDFWIGTNNGLNRLRETGGQFRFETFRHEEGNAASPGMNYITSLAEDAHGRIWMGTQYAGIDIYDPVARTFTHLTQPVTAHNFVRSIIRDRSGKMWAGTQEGLSIFDPLTLEADNYRYDPGNKNSLSQNSIHSLFEDNNGSVWIGTYFGGVNMVHAYNTAFNVCRNSPLQPGISNDVVSGLIEDAQHNLWISTEGGGLNYYNRETGAYTYYRHKPGDAGSLGSNLVKVVYEDADRNIWAGTHGGGLNVMKKGSGQFKRYFYNRQDPDSYPREITSLMEDAEGRFWIGTSTGLHVMRRKGTELYPMEDSALTGQTAGLSIRYLFQDSRGRCWAGSTKGLYLLDDGPMKQVLSKYINAIQEDSQGNIWVSLYYGGLLQFSPDLQTQTLYTEKDGLPHNNVMGLLEDGHHRLWISTGNGLVRFDPVKKTFQTYTTSDGIAGNSFNYNAFLKDSRGELYFGGYNGITRFFPGRIAANTYAAPVRFTGLRLFNQPVRIGEKNGLLQKDIGYMGGLDFRHDQEVFTIEFALLNFVKSSKNRYAYRLEGADRDWIETDQPFVTYTNLSSGSYTLRVKGANNDGVWSAPASIQIIIQPPFWRTWWAYCGYAALLALLFFALTRYFFLQALLRKEEDLHQVKLNFFTHVSHEIRTHLTLLMAPVEKMIHTLKRGDPMQQQLSAVRNNADRLLKLVSELMDFRKAETNHLKLQVAEQDLVPFLQHIHDSFKELSQSRRINASFTHDMPEAPAYFDREQLDKVFFNLLSNAFKFTPEGGRVSLHAAQHTNSYIITVTDNGRGIAPGYLDKLFTNFFQVADHGLQNTGYGIGLALSKHIVELHKGTLTVESEPPADGKEGCTRFTVALQQGSAHFKGTPHVMVKNEAKEIPVMQVTEIMQEETRPLTVHIVEDNPGIRELVRQTFSGYTVLESENGADGLALATAQIPDIVISDVMMPEMDGLRFCYLLKTDERTSHIPVILLTAKSSQEDHVNGLKTGADLYLTKPFSTRVLELNVRNLLASREKMRRKYGYSLQTQEPAATTLANPVDGAFLEKLSQLVHEHMDDPAFGVDMLARKAAMSQPVLYKKLKALTNMSVNDFVKSIRLRKAAELIREKRHTVYEVAYMVGYNDRKYFSREFKKQFGKTPTEYAGEPGL